MTDREVQLTEAGEKHFRELKINQNEEAIRQHMQEVHRLSDEIKKLKDGGAISVTAHFDDPKGSQ